MTATVYVHVGPHKTGTTFVQRVLAANRQALVDSGVLFPGRAYPRHREAVLTLLKGGPPEDQSDYSDKWDALAAEVRAWPGERAIISVENLDAAGRQQIARLMQSFAGMDVHVIFTARDLTKVIPARWHTHMRNRSSQSWRDYVHAVRRDAGRGAGLWSGQDPREVFKRWEEFVPRDRVHVVTVPPSGSSPGILWERFCSVVGLDPTAFSLDVPRINESLGTAESELLRRINATVTRRISRRGYHHWVKLFIARSILEHRPNQTKFAMPLDEHDWVRAHAEEITRFLADEGYAVSGDLSDLLPNTPRSSVVAPDETTDREVLDAAVDVIAGLVEHLDTAEPHGPRPPVEPPVGPGHSQPRPLPRRAYRRLVSTASPVLRRAVRAAGRVAQQWSGRTNRGRENRERGAHSPDRG